MGTIDFESQAVYVSSGGTTFTVPITAEVLNQAGVTLSELNQILTTPGNNFVATWSPPGEMPLLDPQLQSMEVMSSAGGMFPCAFVPCSPWNQTVYGSLQGPPGGGDFVGLNMYWDQVQGGGGSQQPTPQEKEIACRNVRDYSEEGAIRAYATGLTCAAAGATGVGTIGCAAGIILTARSAWKRSKNQKICRGYY